LRDIFFEALAFALKFSVSHFHKILNLLNDAESAAEVTERRKWKEDHKIIHDEFVGTLIRRGVVYFKKLYRYSPKSRDRSVSIALGYGLDGRGSRVRFPAGAGNFSLHHRIQNGSGAHPASYPMCTRALSLEVKRPGREVDHSPPSST
jgi:hypothetical protein